MFGKKTVAPAPQSAGSQSNGPTPEQQADQLKQQILDAINSSLATIRFRPDGTIVDANENFLSVVGYQLDEVVGQHHSIFVDPGHRASPEYAQFWDDLRRGMAQTAEFKRFGRGGTPVWIQASYTPMRDETGKVVGVVKVATDITERKSRQLQDTARIEGIENSQAVIEFSPDGTIVTANRIFQDTMGYSLEQVRGNHHRLFCDPEYTNSADYRSFWRDLANGHAQQGEFLRFDSRGNKVYLQATYTPIVDTNGQVTSVVKFATDITAAKQQQELAKDLSESLASGLAQLSSSASEINMRVSNCANLADSVRVKTDSTLHVVEGLSESSQQIEEVVSLIRGLADQTNLLALNATIESARAGDAGKGFAVVASEVKELARQTGEATKTIGERVHEIQSAVTEAVGAVTGITGELGEVTENTSGVAAAIEEQSAVIQSLDSDARTLNQG